MGTAQQASPSALVIGPRATGALTDHTRLRPLPIQGERPDLTFNGSTLLMYDKEGNLAGQWEGVSGRPGSQDPALQGEVGRGPIPEGDYIARQDRLQQRPTGAWEEFWQLWPRGSAWPGGQRAWGDWRVWLDPLPGTDTLGRSGFSIHGGAVPGSAGCIDLCGGMPSFVDSFRQQGRDMRLRVQYPR